MRHNLDFHSGPFGQAGDLDRGARGKVFREMLCVNIVHRNEVGEIGQKHRAFHNVGERQPQSDYPIGVEGGRPEAA